MRHLFSRGDTIPASFHVAFSARRKRPTVNYDDGRGDKSTIGLIAWPSLLPNPFGLVPNKYPTFLLTLNNFPGEYYCARPLAMWPAAPHPSPKAEFAVDYVCANCRYNGAETNFSA